MKTRSLVVALLVASALAFVAHTLVWNFVTDDAFISFVYARNLVEKGQLVFNLGERVEGYTNFLWTVLLAGLLKVGLQPELMSRVLGTAFGLGSMLLTVRLLRMLRVDGVWLALPALLLASSPGYACWSSGGLETAMFTFFFTAAAGRYLATHLDDEAPDLGMGLLFGIAALTRPEGVLFFALTGLHRVIVLARRRRLPTRGDWIALAGFVVLVAPHVLWRHAYYGWWLPNTFYIKASGGTGTWGQGAYYLLRMGEALHTPVAILVALVGLVVTSGEVALQRASAYVLFLAGVFYVYIASVGGDFMGLFRFAMPVVPLLFTVCVAALHAMASRARTVVIAVTVLLLALHVAHAYPLTKRYETIGADRGIDTPGFLRWYTADRVAIGKWFGANRKADDYAAVGGAGAQVYYSRMPSLDCYGLSDAHIAHDVKAQSNRPGHQKYAPLVYQLSRRPTIITSNYYRCCSPAYESQPFRPSPAEAAEWARRGYRYVGVRIEGLSWPWYSFLLRNDRPTPPDADEVRP